MRKFLAFALFLLLMQSVAFASGPVKIAVFEPEAVLKNSEPGAEAIKQIEAKLKPERDRIEKQEKDFIKMTEDFQKQAFALGPDARQDKERELRRKDFELAEAKRMFMNSANREQSAKLNDISKVLDEVVRDFCTKNGITLLIAKVPGITYFAEPSTDVTKAITLEVNKTWQKRPKK